jgi:hypothetical protein
MPWSKHSTGLGARAPDTALAGANFGSGHSPSPRPVPWRQHPRYMLSPTMLSLPPLVHADHVNQQIRCALPIWFWPPPEVGKGSVGLSAGLHLRCRYTATSLWARHEPHQPHCTLAEREKECFWVRRRHKARVKTYIIQFSHQTVIRHLMDALVATAPDVCSHESWAV